MGIVRMATMVALCFSALAAKAAGDFPLASCKGWNGTVIERDGIDTARAAMRGIVTKADLQEYVDRHRSMTPPATVLESLQDHLKRLER